MSCLKTKGLLQWHNQCRSFHKIDSTATATAMADGRSESTKSPEERANLIGNGKGKEVMNKSHDKETHGTSNDIDEDTPIEKVRGPGILERTKEEIEAVVDAALHHPNK